MAALSNSHHCSNHPASNSHPASIAASFPACCDSEDDGVHGDRMKPLSSIDDIAGNIHKGLIARLTQKKRKDSPDSFPSMIDSTMSVCSKARQSAPYRNCDQLEANMPELQTKSRRKVLSTKGESREGKVYDLKKKSPSVFCRKTDTKPPVYPKIKKSLHFRHSSEMRNFTNVCCADESANDSFCVNNVDPMPIPHLSDGPDLSVKIEHSDDYCAQNAGACTGFGPAMVTDASKHAHPESTDHPTFVTSRDSSKPVDVDFYDSSLYADSKFSDDGVHGTFVNCKDQGWSRTHYVKEDLPFVLRNQHATKEPMAAVEEETSYLCLSPRRDQLISARDSTADRILGRLDIGIISRVRDKKQVYAALGAILGVSITRSLRVDRAHGEEFEEECSRSARMGKSNETNVQKLFTAHSVSTPESGCKRQRPEQDLAVEETETYEEAAKGRSASFGRRTNEMLGESGYEQVRHNRGGKGTGSVDQIADPLKSMSAAVDAASCWLELLRLDVKGRLSALKRSRRRLRRVLLSGQLEEKTSSGSNYRLKEPINWESAGKDWSELHKWRAFFLQMDGALLSEGVRLENWLGEIAVMQSHCEGKVFSNGG